jgi:hypothetical protein
VREIIGVDWVSTHGGSPGRVRSLKADRPMLLRACKMEARAQSPRERLLSTVVLFVLITITIPHRPI